MTETIESLDYALSYDSDHAGAHCLLGRLYSEQLSQFEKAEYHYEQALIHDMNYVSTFEHYSLLLINLKEYERAEKLIKYAYSVKGCSTIMLQHREALILESKYEYVSAKSKMKAAYSDSCNEYERKFLKDELERIKSKLNDGKKKKKGNIAKKK